MAVLHAMQYMQYLASPFHLHTPVLVAADTAPSTFFSLCLLWDCIASHRVTSLSAQRNFGRAHLTLPRVPHTARASGLALPQCGGVAHVGDLRGRMMETQKVRKGKAGACGIEG